MEQPIAALAQRNRELTILNTIARQLNGSAELSAALAGALEQITAHFDLQTGWIWLLDEESGKSYLAAARNLPPALANDPRSMEGDCYCLSTFRKGDLQGAANVNAVVCSRLGGRTAGTAGLQHHASVPLYAQEKKLGSMWSAAIGKKSRQRICACWRRWGICSVSRLSARVFLIRARS